VDAVALPQAHDVAAQDPGNAGAAAHDLLDDAECFDHPAPSDHSNGGSVCDAGGSQASPSVPVQRPYTGIRHEGASHLPCAAAPSQSLQRPADTEDAELADDAAQDSDFEPDAEQLDHSLQVCVAGCSAALMCGPTTSRSAACGVHALQVCTTAARDSWGMHALQEADAVLERLEALLRARGGLDDANADAAFAADQLHQLLEDAVEGVPHDEVPLDDIEAVVQHTELLHLLVQQHMHTEATQGETHKPGTMEWYRQNRTEPIGPGCTLTILQAAYCLLRLKLEGKMTDESFAGLVHRASAGGLCRTGSNVPRCAHVRLLALRFILSLKPVVRAL
jgi:hypothetical protein